MLQAMDCLERQLLNACKNSGRSRAIVDASWLHAGALERQLLDVLQQPRAPGAAAPAAPAPPPAAGSGQQQAAPADGQPSGQEEPQGSEGPEQT